MKAIMTLEGYQFVPDPNMLLCRQVRFPRSKRRRIRRKWALRRENNEFAPAQHVQIDADKKLVFAHPDICRKLQGMLAAAISERGAAPTSNL